MCCAWSVSSQGFSLTPKRAHNDDKCLALAFPFQTTYFDVGTVATTNSLKS